MTVLDPIAQLDPPTVGVVAAIFLATFLVLRRTFFAPLLDAMDRRTARIEAARARRAEAEARLAGARRQAEEALERAREEAARVSGAARERTLRAREARLAKARADAEAALSGGRVEIAALRREEQDRLAEELYACVHLVLAKMIGPVDDRMVRFLVNQALAAREAR
jgi:F0F1-type ATP synthase membrane subunit b/b'